MTSKLISVTHLAISSSLSTMESTRERLAELISSLEGKDGLEMSRATSPGGEAQETKDQRVTRTRPRTYPYTRYLPYVTEDETDQQRDFNEMLRHLYVAVEAGDLGPGAVHWTRELRSWLSLKFDPTKEQRIKLIRLYYQLALAPGVDSNNAERFASMFMVLTK